MVGCLLWSATEIQEADETEERSDSAEDWYCCWAMLICYVEVGEWEVSRPFEVMRAMRPSMGTFQDFGEKTVGLCLQLVWSLDLHLPTPPSFKFVG